MIIKKRKAIHKQVYEYLKNEIVGGNLEEGTRIVEEEFAEKLNISRTPLREALRMLEFEGLVEVREKGGVMITKTTRKDVEEVVKIRVALETMILEELFDKITDKDIKSLEKNINSVEKIVNDDQYALEVFNYFSEFNKILYSISNLSRVVYLINNLNLYLKKFRRLSAKNTERRLKAHNEHKEMVELIKKGKREEIIKLNRQHLMEAKEFLIHQIEE